MSDFWYSSAGRPLYAAETGRGAVVVCLHGGMADHRAVLPYAAPLARHFRVVTPDLRGSGRSHDGGGLNFDQFADDLEALLSHLQADRAVVIGVSSGTGAALRFALRAPPRLAGLGLVLPLYAGAAGYTEAQRSIFASMDALASRAVQQGVEVLKPLYANLPEALREQATAIAMQFDPASVVATSHLLASGAQPFQSLEELRRIGVPTLVMAGADAIHPGEVAEAYARSISGAQLLAAEEPALHAALVRFCRQCFAMSD